MDQLVAIEILQGTFVAYGVHMPSAHKFVSIVQYI